MSLASYSPSSADVDRRIYQCNQVFVVALLVSGFVHLVLFLVGDRVWEDPVSFRKPTLFGLSTGLTLWSCDWCFRQIRTTRYSSAMRGLLGWSLIVEVGLITGQTWRGEASHFNRVGWINSGIETGMLVFIVIAMGIIAYLAFQAMAGNYLPHVSSSNRIAITWGMAYLVLSGGIGFVITFIGHQQQLFGKPPEFWGDRGILKFPHGAALHAIQTLAIVAWLADRLMPRTSTAIVLSVARLHGVLLLVAIVHTVQGRGRFEFDKLSMLIGLMGIGFSFVPFLKKGVSRDS